jgi:hypothetical protein
VSGSSATFPLTKTQSVNFRRWFADFDLAVGLSSVFFDSGGGPGRLRSPVARAVRHKGHGTSAPSDLKDHKMQWS